MKIITIDFETYYSQDFGFSKLTTEEYVRSPQWETIGFAYKIDDGPTVWVPKPDVERVLASIDWSDAMVVCQNTAFDGAVLKWLYGIDPAVWVDIMGMSRAMFPHEKSHSLKAQAERMGAGVKGTEVDDAKGKRYADFTEYELARYGAYCCNDVDLTYDLFMQYMNLGFPKSEIKLIDLTLRMFIDAVLILDKPMLVKHLEDVKERKETLMENVRDFMLKDAEPEYVHTIFSEGMDGIKKLLMSNPKFAAVLENYGVVPPMKVSPTTGKVAFAFAKTDEAFKALLEHPDVRVQILVAARLGNKTTLEETRTERFIGMAGRGNFPVPLRYYGAHSGRWSGQDSVNLQNLPSRGADAGKIKKAIKAPPGYVVIDCDSAQIEARVLAWLAGQENFVQAFKDKQDVYKLMASQIYGIPIDAIDKTQRQVGKTVILGCFGPDTVVLTQRGWVPIIQVLVTDTIWDGAEWVQHQGVIPQGEKEVLTAMGISATADHEILTEHGWVEWSEALANLSHLRSALSLASLPASVGSCARMDPSGKASMVINPKCGARADGKGSWIELIFGAGALPGVMVALRQRLIGPVQRLLGLKPSAPTPIIESDSLRESAPSSAAAQTPTTRSILITEGVESRFIPNGLRSAWGSYDTLSDSTGGTPPNWSSTVQTTVKAMSQAIFGLSAKVSTPKTSAVQVPEKSKPSAVGCDSLKQRMQTYDIAYAGPRNRYTILTSEGPMLVHNCGYGVGHVKLQGFLKAQAGVEVTLEEAKRIIDAYRSSAGQIAAFWQKAGNGLTALMQGQSAQVDAVGIVHAVAGKGLTLPNGLYIQYPGLRAHIGDDGKRELVYTSKGLPVRIYGGKVVENVCQAVARQVVAEQMLRVSKRYKVVLTVHDAIAIIAKKEDAAQAQAYLEECMSWNPKWATGLPLACESGMGESYGDC